VRLDNLPVQQLFAVNEASTSFSLVPRTINSSTAVLSTRSNSKLEVQSECTRRVNTRAHIEFLRSYSRTTLESVSLTRQLEQEFRKDKFYYETDSKYFESKSFHVVLRKFAENKIDGTFFF